MKNNPSVGDIWKFRKGSQEINIMLTAFDYKSQNLVGFNLDDGSKLITTKEQLFRRGKYERKSLIKERAYLLTKGKENGKKKKKT